MSETPKFHIHGPEIDEEAGELTWTAAVATEQIEAYEVVVTVRYPKGNTAWDAETIQAHKDDAMTVLMDLAHEITHE